MTKFLLSSDLIPMTLFLQSFDMTQRGGFQTDRWARHGPSGRAATIQPSSSGLAQRFLSSITAVNGESVKAAKKVSVQLTKTTLHTHLSLAAILDRKLTEWPLLSVSHSNPNGARELILCSVRLPPSQPFIPSAASPFGAIPMDPRETMMSRGFSSASSTRSRLSHLQLDASEPMPDARGDGPSYGAIGASGSTGPEQHQLDYEMGPRSSPDRYPWDDDSPVPWMPSDLLGEGTSMKGMPGGQRVQGKIHSQRRPSNRDEFDGPHQFLERPSMDTIASQERDLPHLPTNLYVNEQDEILSKVNDCLSRCAFDFVAKYQFPIPLEPDKRPVRVPADREWTEWVYLLKRLATKRRVPARVLYNGQIKQLVTVLENSLEMRHAAKHQSRPLKDDRNVLQLISAGLQVAKILKDALAMEALDRLYVQTEQLIQNRRMVPTGYAAPAYLP